MFNDYDYKRRPGDTFGQGGWRHEIAQPEPSRTAFALRLALLFIVVLLLTVILLVIAGERGQQEAGWTWDDGIPLVTKAGA